MSGMQQEEAESGYLPQHHSARETAVCMPGVQSGYLRPRHSDCDVSDDDDV